MKKSFLAILAIFAFASIIKLEAAISDISVNLKLDALDFLIGERIRGVIDVRNISPSLVRVGYTNSTDQLFVEVFTAHDMERLVKLNSRPFVAKFKVGPNEGQKLEVYLGDHYSIANPRRYLARPVLMHDGVRYEGAYVAFDVVPGMEITTALQTFANKPGLNREFRLSHWSRSGAEHLFISAQDEGASERSWETHDLGLMLRITKPVISILPSGKIVVLHRNSPDAFVRSEFWSMPNALEFISRERVDDPQTSAQNRVQEVYDSAGGVKPVERPWWKFW